MKELSRRAYYGLHYPGRALRGAVAETFEIATPPGLAMTASCGWDFSKLVYGYLGE